MLIRVSRAGVNFADTFVRSNSYLAKATLPLTPGIEVVGTREDDGTPCRGTVREWRLCPVRGRTGDADVPDR